MAAEELIAEALPSDGESPIRLELIPDHVRLRLAEVALDGYLAYERYLKKHPDEARRFDERVAEVRRRYAHK